MREARQPERDGGDAVDLATAARPRDPAPLLWVLTAAGWLLLVAFEFVPLGHLTHAAHATAVLVAGAGALVPLLFAAGWVVMLAAMMLPTTVPMARMFTVVSARRQSRGPVRAAFFGAYLAVWALRRGRARGSRRGAVAHRRRRARAGAGGRARAGGCVSVQRAQDHFDRGQINGVEKVGGPLADLAGLVGEIVGVSTAPIEFDVDKGTGSFRVGTLFEGQVEGQRAPNGNPTMLTDTAVSPVLGTPAYRGIVTRFAVSDPEHGLEFRPGGSTQTEFHYASA